MRDIQFRDDDCTFSVRTSGVVIKDGRVLLNRLKTDDFWTFVGGKLAFGESTAEAVLREYREETGAELTATRLAAVVENFFEFQGRKWHEFLYFYELNDARGELELFDGARDIRDNSVGELRWFPLNEIGSIKMQPECAREMIGSIHEGAIRHIVNRSAGKI